RKAIFTFANIPDRINPRDVPTITRDMPRQDLAPALAAALASGDDDLIGAATFLLDSLSKRMGDALRDEIDEQGTVSAKDGEAAMTAVFNTIRTLEASGEITLLVPEDDTSEL
ncbi:MAG: FliG C-terminal domain-containing protein, partial [Roseovarius indicus]